MLSSFFSVIETFCSLRLDANLKVKKTSHSIEALFKKSMPDQAIQLMLLMDYMEEVLEVIQDPISLCDVVTFVSSCVVKDST